MLPIALSRLQDQLRGVWEEGEGEVVGCFWGVAEDTMSGQGQHMENQST